MHVILPCDIQIQLFIAETIKHKNRNVDDLHVVESGT